jgi:hypothetical protein
MGRSGLGSTGSAPKPGRIQPWIEAKSSTTIKSKMGFRIVSSIVDLRGLRCLPTFWQYLNETRFQNTLVNFEEAPEAQTHSSSIN